MCAIYIYIFLIVINGFIPLGEFNAKFKIISWIIISFILIWQNKNTNIKFLKETYSVIYLRNYRFFNLYISLSRVI